MYTWVHNLLRMWMLAVPFWCLWWLHELKVLYREGVTTNEWLTFFAMLIGPPIVAFFLGRWLVKVINTWVNHYMARRGL